MALRLRRFRTILLGASMALLACSPASPPGAGDPSTGSTSSPAASASDGRPVVADLLRDWREQKDTLLQLADAMPADAFAFRPTPEQRTFAEQVMHIAVGNVEVMKLLGGRATPPFSVESAEALTTKDEVIGALAEAYDYGEAVLEEQTPETIHTLMDPSIQFFGGSTRARLVWSLLSHAANIYGQMAVYLRLNSVVPPASRGI